MSELNLLDKKLLYELDLDSRQTFQQLARKLRIGQEVVRYRLNRMLDTKIIEEFMAVIDTGKLGFYHYETYFRFYKLTEPREKELINYLKRLNNLLWISSCNGHYDLVFSVVAKDNIHYSEIISKITNKYGEYIAERNIQATIKIPHFTRSYLLPNKKPREIYFSSSKDKLKIDKKDFKILKTIMNHGRMPIIEIASKTKLSEDVVKYRLKQLRKKQIIQTFRPRINKDKINRLLYQILFTFKNLNEGLKNQFIEFCKGFGNVVYVLDTIGKFDLIIELEPKDQDEFNETLRKIRNEFADKITNYEIINITKEHQMDYFKVDEKEYFNIKTLIN